MIDSHCHLEQEEFKENLDEIIENCKKNGLKGIVTVCSHPNDFDYTLALTKKYKNFVFCIAGIHPEFIKEISEKEKDEFLEKIKKNKDKIVGIGEIGLDYYWIKESKFQEKQRELFEELITFAKDLKKVVSVHCRNAAEDCIKILEQNDVKKVHLHLFSCEHLLKRIEENNWYISFGPIILKSTKFKKIAQSFPLDLMMLETDSPWFPVNDKIGYPWNIKHVARKIAEIKGLKFEEVWKKCGSNTISFFNLNISPERSLHLSVL